MDMATAVRLQIFETAAATGRVPQAPEIAEALNRSEAEIYAALNELAAARIIVLASNGKSIWIAAPYCAVPSRFRVIVDQQQYYGICIWDALGIIAINGGQRGIVHAYCGDCAEPIDLRVDNSRLIRNDAVVHFGVPARHWWDNIGFT